MTKHRKDADLLKSKSFECELKAVADDGSFEAYAGVFGNVDLGDDVLEPGAISNCEGFVKDGFIAVAHRADHLPVAYPTAAAQDSIGFKIAGKFHSTPRAQEARATIKERFDAQKSVKMSIGYTTDDASYEVRGGKQIRSLKSVTIYECSFVNVAMNPMAALTNVKGAIAPFLKTPEEPVEDTKSGYLEALKDLLGLGIKKGVAVSAANHKMLGAFADAMTEHQDKMAACCKSMMTCHKDACKTMAEMKGFIDGFKPADKDADPEDTADGDPPKTAPAVLTKTLSDDDKARAAWREQLASRAKAGRAVQSCP